MRKDKNVKKSNAGGSKRASERSDKPALCL